MDGFKNTEAIRTYKQVAEIMTSRGHALSHRQVWHIERKALQKLREQLENWDLLEAKDMRMTTESDLTESIES